MCLFHALAGDVDETGAIAERDGQAAALRMRAGELMASGYARRLSHGSDGQWNAHVAATPHRIIALWRVVEVGQPR